MEPLVLPLDRPFRWKLFFIVWALCLFGLGAVVPYTLTMQAETLENADLPLPLDILIPVQLASNAVAFGLLIWIGLRMAGRVGLGLPFLEGRLRGEPVPGRGRQVVILSALVGVGVGVAVAGAEYGLFKPLAEAELARLGMFPPDEIRPPAWQGFLASFYGGITEEVLLRLFLMSFLVWLGRRFSRTDEGRPTLVVLWTANIVAAILFGLAHLPATAAFGMPMTPVILARALILNSVGGLAFGWLYFTRGLESAMMAHFSADLVLHVLFAL